MHVESIWNSETFSLIKTFLCQTTYEHDYAQYMLKYDKND